MGSPEQNGPSLQRRTLLAYAALTGAAPEWAPGWSPNWARRLVMLSASEEAAPFALAVLAAGGAVLWTCADEESLRESAQVGIVDFQVTTLTEAARILKNEIRKGLPVSVGVLDAGRTVWAEAVTRGLQPEAVLAGVEDAAAAAILVARGATALAAPAVLEVREDQAESWRGRRAADAALLAGLEQVSAPEREVAERWLRSAPRLFPRDGVRCYLPEWSAS